MYASARLISEGISLEVATDLVALLVAVCITITEDPSVTVKLEHLHSPLLDYPAL
jgi:hypothetical protein